MGPYCKACPVCNGQACKNTIPGPGAKGSGTGFARNYQKWQELRVNLDTIGENRPADTSFDFFGHRLALPVMAAPVGAMQLHYGDKYDDLTYNRLLLAACLLLVLQNAAAIMIGKLSGLDPLLSVLAGSATMTGGHGTGLVFADEFEKVLGLQGAQAAAIACATFGVLAGSLIGGPIAERLIKGRSLANEANIGENYRKEMIPDVFSFGDTGEEINTHSILMAVFQITFAVGLGMWFSEWLGARGILLPAYAIALVAGMAIRNAGDHARLLRVNPRIVKHISGACLSFFLAFALMSVDLTALAGLAAPLISILAVQVVLMILFAFYVTFRLTGGDYQAAVITAGHAGFGLGATPNAIANMEAVCAKYGMAPDAFFAVAAVGAFFIDIVNVVVINVLVKLFA